MNSRGLRNCNPGNLRRTKDRWKGLRPIQTDKEFFQFVDMAHGYRAMMITLQNYVRRHGCRTMAGIIKRYAPPSENNTEAYIAAICEWTGIAADEVLDTRSRRDMVPIVVAMSRIENGLPALRPQVEKGFDLTGWE